jgi:Low-density lipoprotein receptor repeat class B
MLLLWHPLQGKVPQSLALVLDHAFRHFRMLFWTDVGPRRKIEASALDGTGRKLMVSKNLVYPTGLAVDEPNSRVYWADPKTSSIETISFDGTDRRLVKTFEFRKFNEEFGTVLSGTTGWHFRKLQADVFGRVRRYHLFHNILNPRSPYDEQIWKRYSSFNHGTNVVSSFN